MEKLKTGFVGLHRGGGLMRSLSAHPQVEVAALCDIDEETLADTGAAFSLSDEQLFTRFEDFVNAPLDIVVVATPIEYHAEQSIAAMREREACVVRADGGVHGG